MALTQFSETLRPSSGPDAPIDPETDWGTVRRKSLLWLIRDLVCQAMRPGFTTGDVDSGFIGVYADALRLLQMEGMLVDVVDSSPRDIRGKLLGFEETGKLLDEHYGRQAQ